MGKKAAKFPSDIGVYQEIIHEVRPDFKIEIGNFCGGNILFLANMLDIEGHGHEPLGLMERLTT